MTSPSGTDARHPDVSEISELTEGLLPPPRTTELRHHITACTLCADVHRSLLEIRSLLGTLPGPSRMPADVAGRIDAALAAEALLDATTPEKAPHQPDTVLPAASAGVQEGKQEHEEAAGTAPALSTAPHPTGRAPSAGAHVSRETSPPRRLPAGRPSAATGPGRTPRRRRRVAALGAALGVAALGVGALLIATPGSTGHHASTAAASTQPDSSTRNPDDFAGPQLGARVDTLLTAHGNTSVPPGNPEVRGNSADAGTATSNEPLIQPEPQVPTCVRQGTGRSEALLAAQQGTYRGVPAYLLVLADPVDGTRVQVYVVDATCVGSSPTVKGKLLLKEEHPRR